MDRLKSLLPALLAACALIVAALVAAHMMKGQAGPDVAGFQKHCVDHVLHHDDIPASCASLAAIQSAYRLDPQTLLVAAQGKKIETARRIARGDFIDDKAYRHCLRQGECAAVPMPEKGTDENSPAGRTARAEFWQLIGSGDITAASCAAMDICQAMVGLRLIPPPPALAVPLAGSPP